MIANDCHSSYRRKDHLTHHLLQHDGKLFECPTCKRRFAFQGNMKRHMRDIHEETASSDIEDQKQHVCPEAGCGKVLKNASKLRKHEDFHVKLEALEVFCAEPGCMKYFTNEQCLKAHLHFCHQHITREMCGTKQLKNNIKRHLRTHEKHIKSVLFEQKPFVCSIAGCGMRFSFKHVRDNHEKSACHLFRCCKFHVSLIMHVHAFTNFLLYCGGNELVSFVGSGDFLETDEQFQSRPRGGRKRELPAIETLMRKRVVPPCESDSIFSQHA